MTMVEFESTCIYMIGCHDYGGAFCNLNPANKIECAYTGRWNECEKFKPVRQAMREL